jgi:hypothetical protein
MRKTEVRTKVSTFLSQPVPRPKKPFQGEIEAYRRGVLQGRVEGVEFALLEGVDWGLDLGMDLAFSLSEGSAIPAKTANA